LHFAISVKINLQYKKEPRVENHQDRGGFNRRNKFDENRQAGSSGPHKFCEVKTDEANDSIHSINFLIEIS